MLTVEKNVVLLWWTDFVFKTNVGDTKQLFHFKEFWGRSFSRQAYVIRDQYTSNINNNLLFTNWMFKLRGFTLKEYWTTAFVAEHFPKVLKISKTIPLHN